MNRGRAAAGIVVVVVIALVLLGVCRSHEDGPPAGAAPRSRDATTSPRSAAPRHRARAGNDETTAADPNGPKDDPATGADALHGSVSDQTLAPVARAEVTARAADGEVVATAVTGEDGRFGISLTGDGDVDLRADAVGYSSETKHVRRGAPGVTFRLTGCATVAGRVLDKVTSQPVEGCRVVAEGKPLTAMRWVSQPTDAAGRFQIPGLPPRTLQLTAFRGASPPEAIPDDLGSRFPPNASNVVLLLSATDAITGVVVGTDGLPYTKRFFVNAQPRTAAGMVIGGGAFGKQQEGGAFSADGISEAQMPVDVWITPEDPSLPMISVVRAATGEAPLRVEIPASAHIAGRLVDPSGKVDLKSVYVLIRAPDGSGEDSPRVDADGTFRTSRPLPVGRIYDVLAVRLNTDDGPCGLRSGVCAGDTGVDVELHPLVPIRGRVLGEDGGPVKGVTLEAWATDPPRRMLGLWLTTQARDDGSFELPAVPGLTYWIVARGNGDGLAFGGTAARYAPGDAGIEVRVPRGAALTGRLLDADGKPVRGAIVRAQRPGDEAFPWLNASGSTGPDGSFRIAGAPPGRLRLVTWRRGREIPLGDADAPAASVELRLPR